MQVSVVIPCYNAASWVGSALESVAAQESPVHEILVVDDGSSDGSLQEIEKSGVSVRVLETPRLGGAAARNAGIRAATGEWVAFLDADDVWYPDHLARAATVMRGDVAYLAHHDRLRLDGTIEPLPPLWPLGRPTNGLSVHDFLRYFRQHFFFGMGSVVARRDVIMQAGLFDESLIRRHDFELFLRVISGRTFCFDPRAAYAYREGAPGSLSENRASRELFFLLALLKHRESLDCEDMRALVRLGARRAMSQAYAFGDAADRQAARAAALPHLSPADRVVFAVGALFPSLFSTLNRTRLRATGAVPSP